MSEYDELLDSIKQQQKAKQPPNGIKEKFAEAIAQLEKDVEGLDLQDIRMFVKLLKAKLATLDWNIRSHVTSYHIDSRKDQDPKRYIELFWDGKYKTYRKELAAYWDLAEEKLLVVVGDSEGFTFDDSWRGY